MNKRNTLIAGAILLALVLMKVVPSFTILNGHIAIDWFIPVNGAKALSEGLTIHKDFATPLGIAAYLPHSWAGELFGWTPRITRIVEAGWMVVTFGLCLVLLKHPGAGLLLALYVGFPGFPSDPPFAIHEGVLYNKSCIVLTCIAIAAAWTRPKEMLTGLAIGVFSIWCFYTKATMAATLLLGVALTGVWWKNKRFLFDFIISAVLSVIILNAFYLIPHGLMMGDFNQAAHARWNYMFFCEPTKAYNQVPHYGLSAFYIKLVNVIQTNSLTIALLAAVLLRLRCWKTWAFAIALFAWDSFHFMVNSFGNTLPLLMAIWLVLLLTKEVVGWARDAVYLWMTVIGLILATGTAWQFYQNINVRVVGTPGNPYAGQSFINQEKLIITRFLGDENTTNAPFMQKVNNGIELLKGTGMLNKQVFVLDQIDPFPFVAGIPYTKGEPVWSHAGGTFDNDNYPAAERLFGTCDGIMIPKNHINQWGFGLSLSLYGNYIRTNFHIIRENSSWVLLKRKKYEQK